MNAFVLLFVVAVLPQETFVDFNFCRDAPREAESVHCVQLNPAGEGTFSIRTGVDAVDTDDDIDELFVLSQSGLDQFMRLLEDTDYLLEAEEYESTRTVANLGRKTLRLEGEWGQREAAFNFTEHSDVNRLVTFMDGLVTQQLMLLDLEFTLQFDRLGLPTVLESLAEDLQDDRFPDPVAFVDPLRRVVADGRVVNYARSTAERMIEDLEDD
jgi:hypothetical protein